MSFNSKWGKNSGPRGRRSGLGGKVRSRGRPAYLKPLRAPAQPPHEPGPAPQGRRPSLLTWVLVILGSMAAVVVAEVLIWFLAPVSARGLSPFGQVLLRGERRPAVVVTRHPKGGHPGPTPVPRPAVTSRLTPASRAAICRAMGVSGGVDHCP